MPFASPTPLTAPGYRNGHAPRGHRRKLSRLYVLQHCLTDPIACHAAAGLAEELSRRGRQDAELRY